MERSIEDRGIFLFFGDVEDEIAEEVVHWILTENYNGKHGRLTLIINSWGGSVSSAFAVIDVMEGSTVPVRTVGVGALASAGLNIFMAGEKGKRTLTPNTMVMSHQWSWGAEGKEHELIASVKSFELLTKKAVEHYKKYTGLNEKDIRKYLLPASDTWLSASEAKKLHLCDVIQKFSDK